MTRPSATLIGTFILGAAALVVAGVLFFGGGMLREERFTVVSFFDASVAGMRVGAPVTFRGGRLGGEVAGVRLDPKTGRSIIQVKMELVPACSPCPASDAGQRHRRHVPRYQGLTAQLVKQSFVTGLLSVELPFVRGEFHAWATAHCRKYRRCRRSGRAREAAANRRLVATVESLNDPRFGGLC